VATLCDERTLPRDAVLHVFGFTHLYSLILWDDEDAHATNSCTKTNDTDTANETFLKLQCGKIKHAVLIGSSYLWQTSHV